MQAGKMSVTDLLSTIRAVSSKSNTFNAMFDDKINDILDSEIDKSGPALETVESFVLQYTERTS